MNKFYSIVWIVAVSLYITVSAAAQPSTAITRTFAPSDANFANPERGFYHQNAPLWLGDEAYVLDADMLREFREAENITMLRFYFLIDDFRQRPLSDEVLEIIDAQFDAVRDAGLKVIPRFAYNFPMSGDYPYTEPDASLDRVLAHIAQLTPLLRRHADVIAFMEAGFIGAWGEWHSSTHDLLNPEPNPGVNDSTAILTAALLEALPSERMIAMRYAPYKQALFGAEPLSPVEAYSASARARVGAHDDCFLASITNWGSWPEDDSAREAVRRYLHEDNRYLPQGGETCNADEDAQPYIGCENALAELVYFRYSTLNIDYHEDVLAGWRAAGCFGEIERRLGYRFALESVSLPAEASDDSSFTLTLKLRNMGFAAPYNPRRFEIILRSSDGTAYRVDVTDQHDPRRWLPDDGLLTLEVAVNPPAEMPSGEYEVLLNFPDPQPDLYSRPEYSIRLANDRVWEAVTGFNALGVSIHIE